MRIVVTGGSGKLGRVTLDELVAHGHEVLNLDLQPPRESRVPFTRIDFTDFGQIAEALTGVDTRATPVDAVVHLAAIPSAGFTTNAATFRNNVVSSYNVFAAARLAGIKNVVFARPARRCSALPSTSRRPMRRSTRSIRCGRRAPIPWARPSTRRWLANSAGGIPS